MISTQSNIPLVWIRNWNYALRHFVTSVKGQSKLMFKQQIRSSLVAMRCLTGVMIHFVRSFAPSLPGDQCKEKLTSDFQLGQSR